MFDDILGPRREDLKPYLGEKNAKPASVGGVDSPEGMEPKKPQGITGLKGRPVPMPTAPPVNTPIDPDDDLWEDDDCGCDECGCDDECNCDDGSCGTGCLKDEWSTIGYGKFF